MLYFCLLWLDEKAKRGQKKRWFTELNALYYSFCASHILYNYARRVIRSKKRNANGVARWFRACSANSEGGTDAESARENDARFCGSKALIMGLWMEKPA